MRGTRPMVTLTYSLAEARERELEEEACVALPSRLRLEGSAHGGWAKPVPKVP